MDLQLEYESRFALKQKGMDEAMHIVRALASECQDCVEFGVRTGSSTIALLLGCKGTVYSYEMDPHPEWHEPIKEAAGDRWKLTYGRSELATDVPECDLLLHDSWHHYDQVDAEMKAHAHKAKKYLLFHDSIGCASQSRLNGELVPGFRLAVDELMIRDPSWHIKAHHNIRGGLLVLERR